MLAALSARERCAAFRGVLVVKDRVMALVQMYCASWLSSLERVSPSTAELLLPGFFVRTRRKRQVGPCLAGCGSLAEEKKKHAKPARKCDGICVLTAPSARNKNLRFWCRSTSTALIAAVTRPQPPQAVQRRTRNASAAQQAVRAKPMPKPLPMDPSDTKNHWVGSRRFWAFGPIPRKLAADCRGHFPTSETSDSWCLAPHPLHYSTAPGPRC